MVAHGASRGNRTGETRAAERRKSVDRKTILSPLPGLGRSTAFPTARTVGYRLSLLRSYLQNCPANFVTSVIRSI
jgi:hypothetical protein